MNKRREARERFLNRIAQIGGPAEYNALLEEQNRFVRNNKQQDPHDLTKNNLW